MSSLDEEISAYYESGEEARRLDTLARIEEARTHELIRRSFPPPPAAVLEALERGQRVLVRHPGPGEARAGVAEVARVVDAVEAVERALRPGPLHAR